MDWFTPQCFNRIEYYSIGSKHINYAESKDFDFYLRDSRIREPVFFGVAFCIADKIYNPGSGEEMPITKQEFGYVMTVIDVIIIVATILVINLFEIRYREYAHIFDKRSVEMRDFTVELHRLPKDFKYFGKDIILQGYLWEHIEGHVRRAFEDIHIQSNNQARLEQLRAEQPWEIADINFDKKNNKEAELLTKLDDSFRKKCVLVHDHHDLVNGEKPEEKKEKIDLLKKKITEEIETYKKIKDEYVEMHEEILYEHYQMTKENGKTTEDQSISKAYVTFKSMRGKKKFLELFEEAEYRAKKNRGEEEKKFFSEFMVVHVARPPGSIQWMNVDYSLCNRMTRTILIWILAVIIIVGGFILMIYFKDWNDSLRTTASLDTKCPAKLPDIHLVYDDFVKAPKQRQGFMHCFCLNHYNKHGSVGDTLN